MTTSHWISLFILLAFLWLNFPALLRLNRGRFLRNAVVWLGILVLLLFLYQKFGPSRPVPPAQVIEGQAV
jgi:hypothetical protein